jgi:hypothetical protein
MASTQRISVTQALAELKLLDKRIRKMVAPKTKPAGAAVASCYSPEYGGFVAAESSPEADTPELNWTAVKTKSNPVDAEQLRREAQAEWQSFMDLVNRRDRIKKAVVMSNASTRVKVGTWEGTMAEAIEHKSSIGYKKMLLGAMKKELTSTKEKLKVAEKEVQERLDRLLQSELGKDVRTNPDTIQSITVSFRENNKVELVDPLGLAARVKELEEEVESFETNVDWVLSEANGRTMVEV